MASQLSAFLAELKSPGVRGGSLLVKLSYIQAIKMVLLK